jgi:adenylyl-sulfate kinase
VSAGSRSQHHARSGATVWITGLSGAGKSTLAAAVAARLAETGRAARVLDGDELRRTVSRGLGFARAHRAEHARRVSRIASLAASRGEAVLVTLVSPHAADRDLARSEHETTGLPFVEVYVATPLAECERRDAKDLYGRARRGEIKAIAGLDYPYDPPSRAEVRVDLSDLTAAAAAQLVLAALAERGAV